MSKRKPGLDLLRCFCTLLVVIGHSFLSNGYTITPQTGVTMWIMDTVHQLTRGSVGVFLMLTGFLQCNKTDWKSCYRGLPSVLLGYLIAAFISIPVRHFVYGDVQTLSTWMQRLFGFEGAYYGWYVEIYVGLTLLTPFLNMALKNLNTTGLFGFAAVLLILSGFPGLTHWVVVPSFFRYLYPLSYYVLGAIIRRTQPKVKPLAGILVTVALNFIFGGITLLSTDGNFNTSLYWNFPDFPSAMIAVCLFVSLYQINLPNWIGRVLAVAGTGSYGAYLLSHLLDAYCYNLVMPWRKEGRFLLIFLCVTLPIYIISMGMGIGLDRITRPLVALGGKMVQRVGKLFKKKLPQS